MYDFYLEIIFTFEKFGAQREQALRLNDKFLPALEEEKNRLTVYYLNVQNAFTFSLVRNLITN